MLIYEKYHNLTFICIFPGTRRVMNLRHGLQTQLLLLDTEGREGLSFGAGSEEKAFLPAQW